jgi:exopolysaccharide production protein ExoZ
VIAQAAPDAHLKAAGARPRQFVNVQGLRAIAALLVFGLHLNVMEQRFTGSAFLGMFSPIGNWGVDLFFIISGFVMITSTWNDFGTGSISTRFLLRRLSRVYPPYFIILIPITLLYILSPGSVNGAQAIKPNVLASYLLLPQAGFGLLIVGWTLVYEMFFYLVFALVLNANRRYCLPLMLVWGCLTLAIFAGTRQLHNVYLDTYANPLMIEFILGVAIGYVVAVRGLSFALPSFALGVAGIVAADFFYESIDRAYALGGSLRFVLIGIPMALIFMGVVGFETRRGWTFPGWLIVIGNASYSLYLWHEPLTVLIGRASAGHKSLLQHASVHVAWLLFVAVAIVGCSIALYYLIERPLLKFFNRRMNAIAMTSSPQIAPGI